MIADKVAHAMLALLACACLPSTSAELPLAAGEIAAGAVAENGMPRASLLFTTGATVPLSFGEETQLFLWKLRPQDFVRADGTVVAQEQLASVKVRFPGETADPSLGSCGRCLAPWSTSPQPIFPGDSCDVPPFGELMVLELKDGEVEIATADQLDADTAERAESIRRNLRIDWPGACACDDVAVEVRPDARYRFLPAKPEAIDQWPFERWAIHPDGTTAGFSEERIVVIDPSGRRTLHQRPDAFPADLGPIISAVAITYLDHPAFIVAAFSLDPISELPYYLLIETAPRLTARVLSLADADFRPHRLVHVDESRFLMLGGTQDSVFRLQVASFLECSVDGSRIECALGGEQATSSCTSDKQRLTDIAMLSGDRLVGALESGGMIFGARTSDNWTLSCVDEGTFEIAGTNYYFQEAWTGGLFVFPSGRAFLCAGAANERVILTADFSSAATIDEMRAVTWDERLVLPAHFALPCEDFVPGPGPDQITLVTSEGRIGVCSESTTDCLETTANEITGSPVPNRLEQPVPGWSLASFFTDRLHPSATQLFRRRNGGEPELVYGPALLDRRSTAPLVIGADGYARWIDVDRIVRFKRIDDGTVETSTTVIPGYLRYAFDAALDSSNGSFVVLSGRSILRIWEEPPSFEVIAELDPLVSPECIVPELDFFTKLVETRPGEHLATAECGWIAQIRGNEVTPLRIDDWDDPETPIVEGRPPAYAFNALAASQGIVWIGGHHGSLVRVHEGRLERFSLARTREEGEYRNLWKEGHHVDALRAFCPDRVLFASHGQQYITSSPRRMIDDRRHPIEAAPFAFHAVQGKTLRPEFNTTPRAILGPSEHYVILSNRAWSFQYQVPPVRALITPQVAVEDREGILWLGGSDRRLVLGARER